MPEKLSSKGRYVAAAEALGLKVVDGNTFVKVLSPDGETLLRKLWFAWGGNYKRHLTSRVEASDAGTLAEEIALLATFTPELVEAKREAIARERAAQRERDRLEARRRLDDSERHATKAVTEHRRRLAEEKRKVANIIRSVSSPEEAAERIVNRTADLEFPSRSWDALDVKWAEYRKLYPEDTDPGPRGSVS